jgi:signal transduction histidine kinase
MTDDTPLRFDPAALDRLFPFHLIFDRDLRITRAGSALLRVMPALTPPTPFADHFMVRRPTTVAVAFEALGRENQTIFMLAAHAPSELVLKGQMAMLAGGDALAFLGTPWITNLDQLTRLGLTVTDFAIHDSVSDLLVLIQAQQTALDDASRLATQLREARDGALRASRFKSEFLARMSHELRTPLNAILGFSEVLTGAIFGGLSERYRTYAHHINSSGRRLLDLINDLLDLSRIEAGRYELHKQPVVVGTSLVDCLKLVAAEAQRKSIELDLDSGPPGLTIHADPRAFDQIALNLLSNAVKFTDSGGHVRITVAATDNAVTIEVADTGIGIAPEHVADVFEPFRQAHAEAERRQGGSGLGLSICSNLVEMHGGTIGIESTPGHGTTVTVRFPALVPAAASA